MLKNIYWMEEKEGLHIYATIKDEVIFSHKLVYNGNKLRFGGTNDETTTRPCPLLSQIAGHQRLI